MSLSESCCVCRCELCGNYRCGLQGNGRGGNLLRGGNCDGIASDISCLRDRNCGRGHRRAWEIISNLSIICLDASMPLKGERFGYSPGAVDTCVCVTG